MDIKELQKYLHNFADERDWEPFHNPKNLAMALVVEAGELMEIFQWLKPEESTAKTLGPEKYQECREEIADVFTYLIRLADKLDIDLEQAFWEKMEKNGAKYPVGHIRTKFENK
jgi:NTP pyrophosphatase (non-canonical NTP hydrolase)